MIPEKNMRSTKKILIADSGSTKTSWCLAGKKNKNIFFSTGGINPFFRTTENIITELKKSLPPGIQEKINKIFFYGAGIVDEEKAEIIQQALSKIFPDAKTEVQSDLLAAAHATLGTKSGIACILGTGSNSCHYNGKKISAHVPPLGFILGDEGSGAVLGRQLVADYLKNKMPFSLIKKFHQKYSLEYSDFLNSVYKKEKPNRFLAGFIPFLKENIKDNYCSSMVENAFNEFIVRNVTQYPDYEKQPICFVGSVAFHFQEQLKKVLAEKKLIPGIIIQEPLLNLLNYHLD
jgi:glucosamine kinase